MRKNNKKKIFGGILAAIVILLFMLLPLPYYVESPGGAENISHFIKVDGHRLKKRGQYQLVYVQMQRATPFTYVIHFFKPHTDVLSASEVMGTDTNYQEYSRIQKYYMDSAVANAKYVALQKSHYPARLVYQGIYVMQVQKNSSFKGRLAVGDVVEKVDGKQYTTAAGYQKAVNRGRHGRKLTLTVLHQGKEKQLTGHTVKLGDSKRYGIGIIMSDRLKVKTPVKITANMEAIGGPSAGLMMTLQMYEQLGKHNLLQGRKVGGTGTIAPDGSVGEIGGVDKKVVSCARSGCQIFFAPQEHYPGEESNYEVAQKTAKEIHTKMKIVPVKSVDDAIAYLKKTA